MVPFKLFLTLKYNPSPSWQYNSWLSVAEKKQLANGGVKPSLHLHTIFK